MTTVTISYSRDDGTLLLGTSRGDGSNTVLKELNGGWRWSPMLGKWYVRGSRNKKPDTLLIDLTKIALENAGFTVNVTGVAESAEQTPPRQQPKVTPLTVAQRLNRSSPSEQSAPSEIADSSHMQVHVRPDGEIVLDLGSGDSQTAVNFIRALLSEKKNTQLDATPELEQVRQTPKSLGPREAIIWNYLRVNDSGEGVHVINIREDLNMRDKQVAGTLARLQKKGFAARIGPGKWCALYDPI